MKTTLTITRISTEPLPVTSRPEFDLTLPHRHFDAHLRYESGETIGCWRLDVFDSRRKKPTPVCDTIPIPNRPGVNEPDWNEVIATLNELPLAN